MGSVRGKDNFDSMDLLNGPCILCNSLYERLVVGRLYPIPIRYIVVWNLRQCSGEVVEHRRLSARMTDFSLSRLYSPFVDRSPDIMTPNVRWVSLLSLNGIFTNLPAALSHILILGMSYSCLSSCFVASCGSPESLNRQ